MITRTNKNEITYIIKGLSAILIYFLLSKYQSLPFILLHINTSELPSLIKIFYSLAIEMLILILIYSIFEKEFKKAYQDIKKNHKKYFDEYLKYYILALIFMLLSNSIINLLGGNISNNEAAVRSEFELYPIYTFISAVILAPIIEETVFRLSFRAIFKDDFLFITVSSLIFGGLHLLTTPVNYLFPFHLIAYCSCGFAFAYMLKKTNNIFVSMGFHFMHNGMIIAMQTFLLIFT